MHVTHWTLRAMKGPLLKGQAFGFLWVWVSRCSFPFPRKQHAWSLELANLNGSPCASLEHVTYFPMVCFLIYWMRILIPSHGVKVGRKMKVRVYARVCGKLAGAMQVTGLFCVTLWKAV